MKNQNQQNEQQKQKNTVVGSEAKDNEIINNACRAIDIGSIMIVVLMQHDGVRIVEEIIKVVRKIKSSTLACKLLLDFSFENIKKNALLTLSNPFLSDLDKELKQKEKQSDKEINNQTMQILKDKMIEDIVQQLYNARQIAQKLDQSELSQSSSSNEEQHTDPDKEMKDYFTNLVKRQSDIAQATILQLKKTISNLQSENKLQKKLLQDSTKAILQKEQKISSLKNTISKLQQHIIRQVKLQGQNQMKVSSNEVTMMSQQDKNGPKNKVYNQQSTLIKSEALERQVLQLKKQIQGLKIDLHKSAETVNLQNRQLMNVSTKLGYNEELEKQKQIQFMALSRQYAIVKQQVSLLINDRKSKTQIENTQNVSSDSHYDSQNDNCITLMAELEIANEKYKKLEKLYSQLKKQYDKLVLKDPIITKKQSQMSIPSANQFGEHQSEPRFISNKSQIHHRQKNKKFASPSNRRPNDIRDSKKGVQFASDDEYDKQQIMRELKQINKMEGAFSESINITSFASLINPNQMATKIRGFDYANSIIHKISSSKFIQSFESKISFILQYTCLLELYFNRNFLSCIRQQLMMQDAINIKPLGMEDLNPTHFVYSQAAINQQNSFISNSSKMSSSSNKMFINNQFSISQFAHTLSHLPKKGEESPLSMEGSIASLPNLGANKQRSKKLKLQRLQNEFRQISSLVPSQYLNPRQLKDDPQFIAQVQKLRHNGIAQMIGSLMKQNQVFKKCLNQMIKNEQNFTKLNNQIYFDQDGQIRRRSSGSISKHQEGDKQKQNCSIM